MMGLGKIRHIKEGAIFTGGEPINEEEIRISGTQFFGTFQSIRFIGILIEKSKSGIFDFYEGARKSVMFISSAFYYGIDRVIDKCYEWIRIFIIELTEHLKRAHTGILTMYVYWVLIGMTVLFLLLMK